MQRMYKMVLHAMGEMPSINLEVYWEQFNLLLLQTSLLVEIPPYRNQRLSTPVHVNFYVCNGKRKRSQHQHFTFVPANGKAYLPFLDFFLLFFIYLFLLARHSQQFFLIVWFAKDNNSIYPSLLKKDQIYSFPYLKLQERCRGTSMGKHFTLIKNGVKININKDLPSEM